VLYKEVSAKDFMLADKPAEMLANFNKITLDGLNKMLPIDAKVKNSEDSDAEEEDEDVVGVEIDINKHPATNGEIKALLDDLKVLGKKDFKALMKWRQDVKKTAAVMVKEAKEAEKEARGGEDSGDEGDSSEREETEENKILREMEHLQEVSPKKK
jgi:hypothetical protein